MKERAKVIFNIQEVSFTLFFSLLFFAKGIGLYDGQAVFKIFLVGALVCWAVKVVLTEYEAGELLFLSLIMILAGIVYYNTKEKGILLVAMTITGMKGISVKRLFSAALFAWCISYVPLTLLTMTGIMEGPFKVHSKPLVGFLIRWGLGYVHPNVAHLSYFVLAVLIVYAAGKKAGWKLLIALFVFNCFVFGYTVSFTGFLITSFYLAVNGYLLLRKNLCKWEYLLAECVFPACVLISILLPLVLTGKAFDMVNKLMNTRLNLARMFLTQEKITIFGSGMQMTTNMLTMDNSYVFAFMTYGIAAFLLLCVGYLILARRLVKRRANKELAMLMSFLIAGVSEPFLFNTSFKNLTLVFLGAAVYELLAGYLSGKKEEAGAPAGRRQVGLLSGLNKEFGIWNPFDGIMERLGQAIKGKTGRIAVGAVLGGVVMALLGMFVMLSAEIPERILVPKEVCDSVDTKPVYVADESAGSDLGDKVLGYVDDKTPMIPFGGNLVWVEQVRHLAVSFLLGCVFGGMVVILALYVVQYKDVRRLRS